MVGSRRTSRRAATLIGIVASSLLASGIVGTATGATKALAKVPSSGLNVRLISATVAPKSTDAWAVASVFAPEPSPPDSVIRLHHNKWSKVKLKGVPTTANLAGIAAGSSRSVWLVGKNYDSSTLQTIPVLARSTGGAFKAVKLPGERYGQLFAIGASSASNVWLVGAADAAGAPDFVSHWNGHKWTSTSLPMTVGSFVQGVVSTTGPKDTWILADGSAAPALHWNGHNWSASAFPPGDQVNGLTTTGGKTWAVGETSSQQPVALRWTGKKWKPLHLSHGKTPSELLSVTGVGKRLEAVGDHFATSMSANAKPIAFGFGPVGGRVRLAPTAGKYNSLAAVAASSKLTVAVGTYEKKGLCTSPYHPLAETVKHGKWKRLKIPAKVAPASSSGAVACG